MEKLFLRTIKLGIFLGGGGISQKNKIPAKNKPLSPPQNK